MSRKRSRGKKYIEPKKIIKESKKEKKIKKNYWLALGLVAIFLLVLFFNSYFNYTEGVAFNPEGTTLGTRFFVSGPDPYYNMRTCQETMESGYYRFVTEADPLLNYPMGHYGSSRPPLFNMIAISTANVLENFMSSTDALGWAMLFLPAIYGALLVFPVYGIGKELFNKKVGIISALLVPLIPIHLASGHGSSFALFDHDSFLLLLFTLAFYFMIKSLREKDLTKSLLLASLSGIMMAGIQMTWVSSYFIFILYVLFLVVFMLFDVFRNFKNIEVSYKITTALIVGLVLSLPYFMLRGDIFTYPLFATVASIVFTIFYYMLKRLKLPWIVTIPTLSGILGVGATVLYLVNIGIIQFTPLSGFANLIFGEGIYGTKVALTIGEAHTFPLSQTVMSFGPALFWIGLSGFVLYLYRTHRSKWKPENLFFIIIFLVNFWLTTTAGRFLNDLIPTMCIFSGFILWTIVDKIDYKQMIRNIKNIGGFKGIRKGIKISHYIGILFIAFLVIMPNALLSFDAALPATNIKTEYFGEGHTPTSGLGLGQSYIWADACYWLSQQDTEIEKAEDRPGFISWWDYGFYIASMAEHPTVADNYQRGIQAAGNFHTSVTEKEAVAVLIIRIAQGKKTITIYPNGILDDDVKEVFDKYLGNESKNVISYMERPMNCPSWNTLITPEYGNTLLRVSELNAMYHDCSNIITNLTDEQVTMLYHDMMEATGYSIRYYGIDQRDLTSIFGVFPFLSDKSTHGFYTTEGPFFITNYVSSTNGQIYTDDMLNNMTEQEIIDLDITTATQRKDAFFDTFIFRNYYGIKGENNNFPTNKIPTYFLRHWVPVYVAPQITISKYYEGARVNGTVKVGKYQYNGATIYVFDEMGIPHDYDVVDEGKFSVVMPPGNVSLKVFITTNDLEKEIPISITEDEATRKVITNKTVDFQLDLAKVNITTNINETMILNVTSVNYPLMQFSKEVEKGTYVLDELIPDDYTFTVTNSTGVEKFKGSKFLKPNNNEYHIEVN